MTLDKDGIRENLLPEAARELEAMHMVAEEAANRILSAVERIDDLRDRMPEEVAEAVGEAIVEIFEACGFQDLTGQRVGRLNRTIDGAVERVGAALARRGCISLDDLRAGSSDAKRNRDKSSEIVAESDRDSFSEESLLNGPQLPSDAKTQEEIDALMDQLDK